MTPMRLEPVAPRSGAKHYTTELPMISAVLFISVCILGPSINTESEVYINALL